MEQLIQNISLTVYRDRNSDRSTDMIDQMVPFIRPEFSDIIEMTGHFLSSKNWKRVRDTLKASEIVRKFKRIPCFFVDDNLITILCSVHNYLTSLIVRVYVA